MDDQIHLPAGPIIGGLVSSAILFVGWLLRTGLSQSFENLKASIDANAKATDKLASAMETMVARQADHEARLTAIERWQERQ